MSNTNQSKEEGSFSGGAAAGVDGADEAKLWKARYYELRHTMQDWHAQALAAGFDGTSEVLLIAAEAAKLLSALNAMLTYFGMDEDEWSRPTFKQAKEAIAQYNAARATLSSQSGERARKQALEEAAGVCDELSRQYADHAKQSLSGGGMYYDFAQTAEFCRDEIRELAATPAPLMSADPEFVALMAMSEPEIDAELRALGIDPEVAARKAGEAIAEGVARSKCGGYICRLCGKDTPHQHTPEEVVIFGNGAKFARLSSPLETSDVIRRLRSLRVVLGIDSPETRGWAPAVQQEARRTIDAAIAALSSQSEAR